MSTPAVRRQVPWAAVVFAAPPAFGGDVARGHVVAKPSINAGGAAGCSLTPPRGITTPAAANVSYSSRNDAACRGEVNAEHAQRAYHESGCGVDGHLEAESAPGLYMGGGAISGWRIGARLEIPLWR